MNNCRIQDKIGTSWIDYSLIGPGFFYFRAERKREKEGKMGKIRDAFILAFGLSLVSMLLPNPTIAQSSPVLEEIVVTDSRIEEKKR